MTRLESLKAEHPFIEDTLTGVALTEPAKLVPHERAIAALVAALQESEARLAATERLNAKLREALGFGLPSTGNLLAEISVGRGQDGPTKERLAFAEFSTWSKIRQAALFLTVSDMEKK